MFLRRKQSQTNDEELRAVKVVELRKALGPLTGRSLKYCNDACLKRYLEARCWNVDKSKKMLEETLKWREAYKPEEIRWHEVAHEGETGKISRANFHDRNGRTVLILRPGFQNTNSAEGNVRHWVYLLENAILNLAEGQEQISWLIDFTGFSLTTTVSLKTARDVVNILQSHYPERLAIAFLYDPPRFFQAFWKHLVSVDKYLYLQALRYFLDPKTSQKVKFVYPNNTDSVEIMKSYFDVNNLPQEFGGKATMKYDHEEFSRMMAEDDVKTARFWGFDEKPHLVASGAHKHSTEVVPLAPPAS
ncbi:hypothetical protein ACFE04_023006 [Oxalis oulophora]